LAITPIAATNTGVTYTNASTLYIAGAPSAGTNVTITNPYSLYVAGGAVNLGGNTAVTGTLSATGAVEPASLVNIRGAQNGNIAKVAFTRTDRSWSITNETNLRFYTQAVDTVSPSTLVGEFSSTALALGVGISLTGGTSGTGYSFSGSAPATSLTLDSSGNLGVGVAPSAWASANPIKAIQVGRSGSISYDNGTACTNIVAGAYLSATGQWTKIGTTGAAKLALSDFDGSFFWSRAASGSGNFTYTDVMTLDSSGNLGIGTSSPTQRLHLSIATATAIYNRIQNSAGDCYLGLDTSGNTNLSADNVGNQLIFKTVATERARIDSSGNLLVGTTSAPAINVKGCALQNFSDQGRLAIGATVSTADLAYFYSSTALAGAITVNGSVCSYSSLSDQRLKENITDADSASSLIDALQVRKFDWKADGNHQRYGFIAQELVTVAPEAVHQPKDAEQMMAVDYSKLVPMLVKELQSLRARVAQLESKP
jgi:hypothetical protein